MIARLKADRGKRQFRDSPTTMELLLRQTLTGDEANSRLTSIYIISQYSWHMHDMYTLDLYQCTWNSNRHTELA